MKTILKRNLLIGLIIFIAQYSSAQQNRQLEEFTKITAGGAFVIELHAADRHAVYIESGDEKNIITEVRNGELVIRTDSKKVSEDIKLKIYFKDLNGIEIDGVSKVLNTDTLHLSQLNIQADGSANIVLIIKSTNVKVKGEGASEVTLSGICDVTQFDLSGASSLKAMNFAAQKVNIITDGAASAKLKVKEMLTATARGASQIEFTGNPSLKNIKITDAAAVNERTDGDKLTAYNFKGQYKDGDTTKLRIGKRKFMIIDEEEEPADKADDKKNLRRKKMKTLWGGFELGVNGFMTPSMNTTFDSKYKFLETKFGESWFFSLNLGDLDAHIIKNKLALTTGLGFQWNNTHFYGDNFLIPNIDSLGAALSPAKLTLNKLYSFDITAPLLIKFAPGTRKSAKGGFHIAVGTTLHYVTSVQVITETSANGYHQRIELKDDFHVNPFRADATVRIGYDRIKLFANYALTPYFNTSKAPDVRAFSAGITVIGF